MWILQHFCSLFYRAKCLVIHALPVLFNIAQECAIKNIFWWGDLPCFFFTAKVFYVSSAFANAVGNSYSVYYLCEEVSNTQISASWKNRLALFRSSIWLSRVKLSLSPFSFPYFLQLLYTGPDVDFGMLRWSIIFNKCHLLFNTSVIFHAN